MLLTAHEADLHHGRFDAPQAPGLDAALQDSSVPGTDQQTIGVAGGLFAGLYEFYRCGLLLGRDPA
jgi:hypothetical protein